MESKLAPVRVPIHRSVLFQTIIVGIVSFSQPGIWNALNNLGAGGQAKPYLINAANALTYGIMTVGCVLAGGLCNKIGVKWTLVLGVIFYTPYASALYCNNRFGIEWYVLFGSALCGIGASMFWASEAAIAVGYPLPSQRGRMVSLWLGIRNLAPLIGGSISLALNVDGNKAGKVSYSTYLALIGLQCVGLPAALLLSPPHKVVRADGSHPASLSGASRPRWRDEARAVLRCARRPHMLLLVPVFIVGTWGTTYQSNYLTTYFSVRSRALASLLTAIANIVADVVLGVLEDAHWFGATQRQRARRLWAGIAVGVTALWVWQTVTEVHFRRNPTPVDWADLSPHRFRNGIAVYVLWKFAYEGVLNYVYWLTGTFEYEVGGIERAMGLLRTYESVGSTFSYVIGATHWPNLNQGVFAFVLWVVCVAPTGIATKWVPAVEQAEPEGSSGGGGGGGDGEGDVDEGASSKTAKD
ncbi:unnamed protein product [Parajaminaea phylloscopi]